MNPAEPPDGALNLRRKKRGYAPPRSLERRQIHLNFSGGGMTRIRRLTKTMPRRRKFCRAPWARAIARGVNAHAATIVVDSAGTDSETGLCTIVDAVTAVNTAAAVNGCAAGDGDNDTIDLNSFT